LSIKEVLRYKTSCPSCGREEYNIVELIYEVPYLGKLLLSTGYCNSCGYRSYDTINLDVSSPIRIEVYVDSDDALNSLIVRGKKAIIKIPEFKVEITPGPFSEPYITTVEGILYRILEVLSACDESEERERCRRMIEDAIDGKISFTLILEDPTGRSTIIPKGNVKVKVYKLMEEGETLPEQ